MKHFLLLFLVVSMLSSAAGQKRLETALVFKAGNYTTPHQKPAFVYQEGRPQIKERTLPGYIGMAGIQERWWLGPRWSIAAEALFGFGEYGRRDVFRPCLICDCIGFCGDLQDKRYALYQVVVPVHADLRLKPDSRWSLSLGVAFSYTFEGSESTSTIWLGSEEPKQPLQTEPVDFHSSGVFYNPRWQTLLHGGVSCRISDRTHIGLETFWNPRSHTSGDGYYGWEQTAPPPGVMKNVSVAVRNVLGNNK